MDDPQPWLFPCMASVGVWLGLSPIDAPSGYSMAIHFLSGFPLVLTAGSAVLAALALGAAS